MFLGQLESVEANDAAVPEDGQKQSVEQQWGRFLSRRQPLCYQHWKLRGPAMVKFSVS